MTFYGKETTVYRRPLILSLLASLILATTLCAAPQPERQSYPDAASGSLAQLYATAGGLQIVPETSRQRARLAVSGPDGYHQQVELADGKAFHWSAFDADGQPRPDGVYRFELHTGTATSPSVQRGHFRLLAGDVQLPLNPDAHPETTPDKDQVFADDVIAERVCAGTNCANGETFGFEALRLHSYNNHIDFVDSSGANYATRDWRLEVNDTSYLGSDRFAVRDVDADTQPFGLAGGAPDYSLWIDSNGRLGLGTSTPAQELHMLGTSPTLRLDQPAGAGITAQRWDLGVNTVGRFQLHDISNSSTPINLYSGAPSYSLSIDPDGNVGLGIQDPLTALHLVRDGALQLRMQNTNINSYWALEVSNGDVFSIVRQQQGSSLQLRADGTVRLGPNGTEKFLLQPDGDLEIAGTLTQNSDVHSKTGFAAVDPQNILEQVAALPITTWTFKNDAQQTRHMGPMAQDFHATFELGERPDRLAPVDVDGVTLAAIQALYQQLQEQRAELDALSAENALLRTRLDQLERSEPQHP